MHTDDHRQRFDTWLRTHSGVLFKVVRAYAFTPEDRDDLFQEIALQVWHAVPTYREEAAVTTFLYRIALYVALGWSRREKKHRRGRRPLDDAPLTTLPRDDRLDWVYDRIAALNPVDRSLMLLLLDGFSYREMAAILGISESNVGVKISRIKKRLSRQSTEAFNHGL